MNSVAQKSASTLKVEIEELLRKYATQLVAVLSLIIGISGVMMFFKLFKPQLQGMHSWLGLAFVLAVALHLTRNRRMLFVMLSQRRLHIMWGISIAVVIAFLFAAPTNSKGGLEKEAMRALQKSPLALVAPALGITTEDALGRLKQAGLESGSEISIATAAQQLRLEPGQVLAIVLGKSKP
jgi:Domain of unknown function (DUF4405)